MISLRTARNDIEFWENFLERALEEQIGPLLRQRGWKLVAAESCTGGLIGHRVTNVPG